VSLRNDGEHDQRTPWVPGSAANYKISPHYHSEGVNPPWRPGQCGGRTAAIPTCKLLRVWMPLRFKDYRLLQESQRVYHFDTKKRKLERFLFRIRFHCYSLPYEHCCNETQTSHFMVSQRGKTQTPWFCGIMFLAIPILHQKRIYCTTLRLVVRMFILPLFPSSTHISSKRAFIGIIADAVFSNFQLLPDSQTLPCLR
jgi:hypothetical protein